MFQRFAKSFFFLLFITQSLQAAEYSRVQLQEMAENHAQAHYPAAPGETIKAKASAIDPRKKIQPCEQEVSVTAPNISSYSRNMTLRLRCLDTPGWSLFIPVRVQLLTPMLIAQTHIAKGESLTSSQVKVSMVDKSYARNGTLTDAKMIFGSKAKKAIRPGQPIMNNNICVVCKGELVSITAKTQGLEVKAVGIAQSDGSFGDTISVQNKHTKRIVHGRVTGVGEVQISL